MPPTLEIASIPDQHAFNLRRWSEICADPALAGIDYRIETDRYGQLIMTLPPGIDHGGFQFEIGSILRSRLTRGKVLTECPISTSDGVKAADVVWISRERMARSRRADVLIEAPEICVEVLSPSNTREEIDHKKRLYFEAGAEEVWLCDRRGRMFFFIKSAPDETSKSQVCPDFPHEVAY